MTNELTMAKLEEAIRQLPVQTYPRRVRISPSDYRRLRAASDILRLPPEQSKDISIGFMGEEIVPDPSVSDGTYEYDL